MCDKDWSEFKSAKAYYKACGDNGIAIYDINDFKKKLSKLCKELEAHKIYLIYLPWAGVGNEAQYIIDEAYNILQTDKKYKDVDIMKSFKMLYSEDFLYRLIKTGEINIILDYSNFKTAPEKKQAQQMLKIIMENAENYFPKSVKLNKNTLNINIKKSGSQNTVKK